MESTESDIVFTCALCGKDFPPDPLTMVEAGFSSCSDSPDCECGCSGAGLGDDGISFDDLAAMNEYQLSEIGLTLSQRDELLKNGEITSGGMCICLECQDESVG